MTMRRFIVAFLAALIGWSVLALPGSVAGQDGGDAGTGAGQDPPPTVRMARATWDTGWFQAEVYRQLLVRLGYEVTGPVTMENAEFYDAVSTGQVHLWANGWFPLHESLLDAHPGAERVGTQVLGGALQGYFADAATAAEHNISGLADLADPDLAELFDMDGDGRADLIGCNVGWSCAEVIDHHIDAYGLTDTVEQVSAHYSPLMTQVVTRYDAGLPVLFYTWTPNWTVGYLVPGQDVVWLETPFPSLPPSQAHSENRTLVGGVAGCPSDPCATGWPPNDIAVVANSAFLEANPSARILLEEVSIPLEAILDQNAALITGFGDPDDFVHQAADWIAANAQTVNQWLQRAHPDLPLLEPGVPDTDDPDRPSLTVAARVLHPFVIYEDRAFRGFEIDLARMIAHNLGADIEFQGADSVAKQIDEVTRGAADLALGGVEITRSREELVDFSQPVLSTGLTILVPADSQSGLWGRIKHFFATIADSDLPWLLVVFAITVMIAAHLIWWLERRHNQHFAQPYGPGLWDSFYWSVVTMSTVGYGDKVAKRPGGRAFTLLWITFGTLLFAAFTASIASSLAVSELEADISAPNHLRGHRVATLAHTAGESYLTELGVGPVLVDQIEHAYHLLDEGDVDAVVFDAPVLRYHAARSGDGEVITTGGVFDHVQNAFMVSPDNPELREDINRSLLELLESGAYDQLFDRWFGDLE